MLTTRQTRTQPEVHHVCAVWGPPHAFIFMPQSASAHHCCLGSEESPPPQSKRPRLGDAGSWGCRHRSMLLDAWHSEIRSRVGRQRRKAPGDRPGARRGKQWTIEAVYMSQVLCIQEYKALGRSRQRFVRGLRGNAQRRALLKGALNRSSKAPAVMSQTPSRHSRSQARNPPRPCLTCPFLHMHRTRRGLANTESASDHSGSTGASRQEPSHNEVAETDPRNSLVVAGSLNSPPI